MIIIRTVRELQAAMQQHRDQGQSIGLVPTMGALHQGHLSLMNRAREDNEIVVASVFVNPTQFNNPDDLRTYPRTEEADCQAMESVGVDYAFIPTVEEIYPEPDTRVFDLGPVAEVMEHPSKFETYTTPTTAECVLSKLLKVQTSVLSTPLHPMQESTSTVSLRLRTVS